MPEPIRNCGLCNACCVIPEIREKKVNKLPYMPCEFLKEQKCSIYDSPERPEQCKEFMCAWRVGYGNVLDNPHYNGVMASINEINGETAIYIFELSPKAMETKGKDLVDDIVGKTGLPVKVNLWQ
jgi:Fe-S-cluster containining protein